IVLNPQQSISSLALLSEAERHQLLYQWNDTDVQYRTDRCIHELFEEQVERSPESVAVVFEDQTLSYRELNNRANQLAHYLQAMGVGPDQLVGLCMERSIEMVVAILGILKAGGAYLPLDPDYPLDRINFMLEDAEVSLLLTQRRLIDSLFKHWTQVVCLDTEWRELARHSEENPSSKVTADNLAYVIYTSGSTGKPKGVMVAHRGVNNLAEAQINIFGVQTDSRVLQFASLSFDASVFEIMMAFKVGATLLLGSREALLPGLPLMQLLRDGKITNITLPPSALTYLPEEEIATLRTIVVAGEACTTEIVERWAGRHQFFNAYGPTEATVWSTVAECNQGIEKLTIGRPIANTQVYILDRNLQPVPIGVAGELYISGVGLARGYLNHAELTAERFIPNPFSNKIGERLYKSGDLARYLADAHIEFLGRIDDQIKLRGFRIELGEIEAVLLQHPNIRENIVLMKESANGDKQLVAYIVANDEMMLTVSQLRSFLSERLPDYMIPAAFVVLTTLPLTPNGKVDKRALLELAQMKAGLDNEFVIARTPIEEIVTGIWSELLKIEYIGVYDNFFELGGHSLLATQVISRIRNIFQIELSLRSLFEAPTVVGLANKIVAAQKAEQGLMMTPITRVSRDSEILLSFAQQRLWFLDQLEPGSNFYNMPMAVRLGGRLNIVALTDSLSEIVRRHEVLRTSFSSIEGKPVQQINSVQPVKLSVIDLSEMAEEQQEAIVAALASEEAALPFDLGQGPLMRVKLLRISDQEHMLLITIHHIVSDGWSQSVLVKEMAVLYEAYSSGQASPLPELPIQYADFAVWQRQWMQGEVLEQQLVYWRQQLAGNLPVLALPTDRPYPQKPSFRGAYKTFLIPNTLSKELVALSRQENATLFIVLLAAFKTLLYRYTGQDDIILGVPNAGRNHHEIEGLIGFFINMLVIRTDLSGNPTFRELLSRVRKGSLDAFAHQDLPFEKIVEELRPDRKASHTPLFQVTFGLQNAPMETAELPNLTLDVMGINFEAVRFDLTLWATEGKDGIRMLWTYSTDLFDEATIIRLQRHFEILLSNIVAQPETRLNALEILAQEEKEAELKKKKKLKESNLKKFINTVPQTVKSH
ncbi:MAG: amino acid adenylation domain-containing protein, partial [Acidobacteriota bacterium]